MRPASDTGPGGGGGRAGGDNSLALRAVFEQAVDAACDGLTGDEFATVWFEAERSSFVRLNAARLRQAGSVERPVATLRLVCGQRQASMDLTLTGHRGADQAAVAEAMAALRAMADDAPDDPHLLVARSAARTEHVGAADTPDALEVAQRVAQAARGLDLAGFVASGPIARGFAGATAAGVERAHWFEHASTRLDFSIHRPDGRAVKAQLADGPMDAAAIEAAVARAARLADWLALPAVMVPPGEHRALLEPAAVAELLDTMRWGGFSLRAQRTRSSPLARLHDHDVALDARVTLSEEPGAGGAPRFQPDGFELPPRLVLVEAGRSAALLTSPRSAREFGVDENGAATAESPVALRMAAGTLAGDDALAALGTGLRIGNLWYLNWSDRTGGRMTGMTRFATFWVRNGQVVGPVAPLRFDDTIYRMLGSELLALGDLARAMPDLSTYDGRTAGGITAPAALLGSLRIVS